MTITLINLRRAFYKHHEIEISYLDFNYNTLELTALYDRKTSSLLFIRRHSSIEAEVKINDYFDISLPILNKQYYNLIKLLEIKYSSTAHFNPKKFFIYFDSTFRFRKSATIPERNYLARRNNLEDPDAIYFQRIIDHRNRNNGHVTEKNRKKVKYYFPKLYSKIKDFDISIGFTANIDKSQENSAEFTRYN